MARIPGTPRFSLVPKELVNFRVCIDDHFTRQLYASEGDQLNRRKFERWSRKLIDGNIVIDFGGVFLM